MRIVVRFLYFATVPSGSIFVSGISGTSITGYVFNPEQWIEASEANSKLSEQVIPSPLGYVRLPALASITISTFPFIGRLVEKPIPVKLLEKYF